MQKIYDPTFNLETHDKAKKSAEIAINTMFAKICVDKTSKMYRVLSKRFLIAELLREADKIEKGKDDSTDSDSDREIGSEIHENDSNGESDSDSEADGINLNSMVQQNNDQSSNSVASDDSDDSDNDESATESPQKNENNKLEENDENSMSTDISESESEHEITGKKTQPVKAHEEEVFDPRRKTDHIQNLIDIAEAQEKVIYLYVNIDSLLYYFTQF